MAISTTNLVPVDFETIKENLKYYLRSQTIFKDVDFEASNINVLLDVLAYNTYHNSFYLNMVASEMFLDTAQLQNSVTSHAKMLNYVPRSYRSAKATVNITITPPNPSTVESILIPKGASFTGRAGSKVYTFTTDKNIVVNNIDNTFVAAGVDIYEGRYLSEVFVYSATERYVISNAAVDTTSITVVVTNATGTPVEYTRADSFIGVDSASNVFFIQPAENGQYEILFGDGTFGGQPTAGATVVVEYRVSSGELPNTAAVFDSDGTIGGFSNITITVDAAAAGGAVAESLDAIRFRAPLTYSTQQRAVTTSDYKTLIQNEFPDVSDVGVFGGEDLYPPRYGYVAVSMISDSFDAITDARKQDVLDFIRTKCAITITPIAVDPEFSYVELNTVVSYDPTLTSKAPADLELQVLAAIKAYATTNGNGFNKTMYYSKLIAEIDTADTSIVSNDTSLRIYRLLNPSSTTPFETTVEFGNAIKDSATLTPGSHSVRDTAGLASSFFTYEGKRCLLEDDGNGKLLINTEVGDAHVTINPNAGSVDYSTGRVTISVGIITGYEGQGIRLYATLASKNISAVRNTVLVIRDNDINITMSSIKG